MNRILFIITGSIAANKCEEIIGLLSDEKFQISCVLTKEAKKYLNIKKIKKFTNNRVFTDESEEKNKMLHINLSRKNDIVIVCPASANSIAKFANGYGDNLASNTILASNKKILIVPAMNSQMWSNKSNQVNIEVLKNRGYDFIGPEIGNLKCGEFGIGRISSKKKIIEILKLNLKSLNLFKDKKCLVTAGPTLEMIDPIRYISNQSSGKQAYEIASQLALNGANVVLISGPTNLHPLPNVKLVKIKSADEMYKKVRSYSNIDYGFFAAAVSDFKNKFIKNIKIQKKNLLNLKLVKNVDILEKIGNDKNKRPKILIGFAAETGNISKAKHKLKKKNCDIVIYNKINKENQVFGSDYNKISIITKKEIKNFKKMTKVNCAKEIIKYVYHYQINNE